MTPSPQLLQEEDALVEAHKRLGNRWSDIARCLNGRSENAVKVRALNNLGCLGPITGQAILPKDVRYWIHQPLQRSVMIFELWVALFCS